MAFTRFEAPDGRGDGKGKKPRKDMPQAEQRRLRGSTGGKMWIFPRTTSYNIARFCPEGSLRSYEAIDRARIERKRAEGTNTRVYLTEDPAAGYDYVRTEKPLYPQEKQTDTTARNPRKRTKRSWKNRNTGKNL